MWTRKKEQAPAVPSVEQAGEAARRLADELLTPIIERAPEAMHAVTGAGREVGPAVAQLVATVGEAAAGGRRQLAEAAETFRQQVTPPLANVADAVSGTARKASVEGGALVEDASERLARQREALAVRQQEVAQAINPAAAVEAATSAGRQVQQATGKAAKRAGGFVGDTVGALFWLAAAGALLYYAFASEEQRARITGAIGAVYEQATELYRDFQGYSDEM